MAHAIPGGIVRVNKEMQSSLLYIYTDQKIPSGMFTVGEEEKSPLTMFTPVLPLIRNQIIYSRFHIREVTFQMTIPF